MTENELSYIARSIIFKVYSTLGPGLLESAYEAVLQYEFQKEGLIAKTQVALPLIYEDIQLEVGYRIDLLINEN